jgi:hypothetical protein
LANVSISPRSSVLGDPEFPKSAENLFRGGRIRLYEEVYQRYSRLAFTRETDRPVAINGLEKRLLRTFGTKGGFGIFEHPDYLLRCLLWQRAAHNYMSAIIYPESRKVPSWSWMAYDGWISYTDVPFGQVCWPTVYPVKLLHIPLDKLYDYAKGKINAVAVGVSNDELKRLFSNEDNVPRVLEADSKTLLSLTANHQNTSVVFDMHISSYTSELRCVVVAWDRFPIADQVRRYYVLVVRPLNEERGLYRRAGAGYVSEEEIEFTQNSKIWIV